MIDMLYAMGQAPAQGEQAASPIVGMMPIILIFFVFYFLLIRPQRKQAKVHQEMINNVKKGAEIVTNGGIHGKIISLKGKEIEVEIAPNTKILLNKQSISIVKNSELVVTGKK